MSWSVRHQGSPRAVEGVGLQDVVNELQEGHWEPTDEIKGPDDADWVAIEDHPALAEVVLDLEPPPRKEYDDETRLDMTPLIDVTLVLLIFFILTSTYAALQQLLEQPDFSTDAKGPRVVTQEQVAEMLIQAEVRMENGAPVIRVENAVVAKEDLVPALARFVRDTKKTQLLLKHDYDVPHGVVVAVQDAAKGAGMNRVMMVVPEQELTPR